MGEEEKLKHASSRRVFLIDGKVVKFYPPFYGYILHDIFFMFFSLFFFHTIFPISVKKKIRNEVEGRKFLRKLKFRTTKIKKISKNFIEEKFEKNALSLSELEILNPGEAIDVAERIGEITRKLHEENLYFIDNRASNWLFDGDLIRTDLELFRHTKKSKKFFIFCDLLSFLSSVESKKIREKFLEGYGKSVKISGILRAVISIYIKLTDLIF
ncbi:MAG: hypothetical protein QW228_02780 [Candidatus Aenigmatarchaeota archaeon]